MRRFTLGLALFAVVGCLALAPDRARAEGFIDLYVGGAFPTAPVIDLDGIGGGLRGGGYYTGIPYVDLGFALDVSFYKRDNPLFFERGVITATPMFMVRVPVLTSDRLPHGLIQPYLGVGPGLYTALAYGGGITISSNFDVGADVRLGVKVLPLRWLALFLEYGYSSFDVAGIRNTANHVTGGVGFHF